MGAQVLSLAPLAEAAHRLTLFRRAVAAGQVADQPYTVEPARFDRATCCAQHPRWRWLSEHLCRTAS